MHGDAPSGVSPAAKMIDEFGSGNACFVAGEIESNELVAKREERFELTIDGTNAEGSAQNTDELYRQSEVTDSGCYAITHGFDDPLGVEPMRVGHETRAEPKLDVVEPFTSRVFDVLIGDAPAGVVVRENARHELDPAEKASQVSFRFDDLQMRTKRFELERRKLEVVLNGKLENRLETQVAIEMPVQIDEHRTS